MARIFALVTLVFLVSCGQAPPERSGRRDVAPTEVGSLGKADGLAWGDSCQAGQGSFSRQVDENTVVLLGTIPAGVANATITLKSDEDLDLQLYRADGSPLVQWPDGQLSGADEQATTYAGVTIVYSGYNGVGGDPGHETLAIEGEASAELTVKVFGYARGEAEIAYSWEVADGCGQPARDLTAEVVFAPVERHEDKVVEWIEKAEHSIDIAMYNYSDKDVTAALEAAVARGVAVRFIFHKAQKDVKDPDGSRSSKLEDVGVDVRFVSKSKIMHHKFMIVDGPRAFADGELKLDRAGTALLVTGSGNWAGGPHDENTLFLSGVPELALAFQAEFNELWTYSYDFVWKPFDYEEAVAVDTSLVADDPLVDTFFTTENFRSSQVFTYEGTKRVVEQIVEELKTAKTSIHVASGHMRSVEIYDALVQLKKDDPSLDIKVYLDGQEYTGGEYKDYYGYRLHQEGVPVRFKYYAYRWDYLYAPQLHNKYLIIDGEKLITGSYNLSDNAETKSFENMVVLSGAPFAQLIARYEADFVRLWTTEDDGQKLAALKDAIANDDVIPLVFSPMALTHPQIQDLKVLIEENCPAADKGSPSYDPDYGANPSRHRSCPR